MDNDNINHLAWFLGPKAEHGHLLEESLLLVLRDYIHWRRNYFPGDKALVSQRLQADLSDQYDSMSQATIDMLAELRRNFPFYSPRYIAHQLSDTTMPSMIGYFAGMLFNPNNVTPEAAPVTVDWEIQSCAQILEMLGFNAPPDPPLDSSPQADEAYASQLNKEFGWAHITLGGTTANIEALWVARTVRYAPLAIWDVANQLELDIPVPSARQTDDSSSHIPSLRHLSAFETLLLKPNEAIYLLSKFVKAVKTKFDLETAAANRKSIALLRESKYSLSNGTGTAFQEFPPTLFVSGAAHYSISKAADVLGIGRQNVKQIKMDEHFRIDVGALEQSILKEVSDGRVPLAVVAIAGTTEEGAVDPIHRICDLRRKLESDRHISFWLHIDSAWAGYLRCLFRELDVALYKIGTKIGIVHPIDYSEWHTQLFDSIRTTLEEQQASHESFKFLLIKDSELSSLLEDKKYTDYLRHLKRLVTSMIGPYLPYSREIFDFSLQDRMDCVDNFVKSENRIQEGSFERTRPQSWGSREVSSAFVSFGHADSITVDPHKMGYLPYPCGVVAFKNDRIRHFILEDAPYITSAKHSSLIHLPPKHRVTDPSNDNNFHTAIDAFAPFILEGSRPGAAAAALWMSTKTIPLHQQGQGQVVRPSLLAARELFQWIQLWDSICSANEKDTDYEIIPLTSGPPDTNIVTFVVKKARSSTLASMNRTSQAVYDHFTIQAELGARQYSYSQPFFLSKTVCENPNYSLDTMKPFFQRSKIKNWKRDYENEGVIVLRASVMSPYIHPLSLLGIQHIIREFMNELDVAAADAVNSNR